MSCFTCIDVFFVSPLLLLLFTFPTVNSCGGVAAVAKALEQDFVPPGAALAASAATAQGRTSSTSGGGSGSSSGEKLLRGVLVAAADASSSSFSNTATNATSAGFDEMFPTAKASAARVSAQAVSCWLLHVRLVWCGGITFYPNLFLEGIRC